MISSRSIRAAHTLLLAALLAGYGSLAQSQATGTTGTTGSSGSTAAARSGGTASYGNGGANVNLSRNAVPSSQTDQTAWVADITSRSKSLATRVSSMLDAARLEKDVMKATCLNNKLTEVDVAGNQIQEQANAFQKLPPGNGSERNHVTGMISLLADKLDKFNAEANQCVGEDLYRVGPTTVTTEINTALMPFETDPTTPPTMLPPTLGVTDLPAASSPGS
jgi:hypothetical protein